MAGNIEEIKFGWGVVVEIVVFIAGLMGVYFTQKGRIDRLENQFDVYFKQSEKDKNDQDLEIEALKADVKKNKESVIEKFDDLKEIIHNNHIEILRSLNQRK